jgi:endoglucanase
MRGIDTNFVSRIVAAVNCGRRFSLWLLACLVMGSAAAQTNPVKLATVARVDVNASAGVRALDDGEILTGSGGVERQSWLPTEEWPRTLFIQVPIIRFGWTEFAVRFVPAGSGTVRLSLRGPWEEVTPGSGTIYQQDVLWDGLSAEGTTLANGSFEDARPGGLTGWSGGEPRFATGSVSAVEGGVLARAWHDDSMNQELTVRAGEPVVLRCFARAAVPSGFQDMARITDRNTPAHQSARKLMRGVNFGNSLELPPNSPGRLTYSDDDFAQARAEGFDHVRLPVAWHHSAGPGPTFTLAPTIFAEVDVMVSHALNHGLGIIVDIHNFEQFTDDPPAYTEELFALWRQIAAHLANAPPAVLFEVLNEPRDAATTIVMNAIYAEAIRQIRLTNPARTILLGPGAFNGIDELNHLLLPDTDANLIATVHTYDPFLFTHQGLPWAGADVATTDLRFPGPPAAPLTPASGMSQWATNWITAYNTLPAERNPCGPAAFRARLQMLKQWSDYYGRPVYVGEFGAYETIEAESRVNYYRAKRTALDEAGLGWAIWDWKAGFHYWKDGQPEPPGLREALFPSPELHLPSRGVVEFAAAVGKTFRVERAFELKPPVRWETISTQTLLEPQFRLNDPDAGTNPAAFYRVTWSK